MHWHSFDPVDLFSPDDRLFRFEYLWADGAEIKTPIRVSAPEYVDYLMTWIQDQLDDERIFPSKIGAAPTERMSVPADR